MKKLSLHNNIQFSNVVYTQINDQESNSTMWINQKIEDSNNSNIDFGRMRITNEDNLQVKQKGTIEIERDRDETIDISKVDIIEDYNLQETRAVIQLLMNQQRQKCRSRLISIHKLKTKGPLKNLTKNHIIKNQEIYQQQPKSQLLKTFATNFIEQKPLNKQIEDIFNYQSLKSTKIQNQILKKVNHNIHQKQNIRIQPLHSKSQIKTTPLSRNNSQNQSKFKNKSKLHKLTINIKETIKKNKK